MKKYLDIQNGYTKSILNEIANVIKNGGIVIFPTDTVYGIGANGLDKKAVEKLYNIKKRDLKNPTNLLVSNIKMIEDITQNISPVEYELMEKFFPGPFTIILEKKSIIPDIVTANSKFVGVRIPNNKFLKDLITHLNIPIAAPSANISGNLSATNFEDIADDFSDGVDYIINGGTSNIGIESTIVRVINGIPHILRPGFITPEEIKKIAGNVIVENNYSKLLPSSKMKHYQLNTKSLVVYSKDKIQMSTKIIDLSKKYKNPIIICFERNKNLYSNQINDKNIFQTSFKNLFSTLRKANNSSADIILIEGIEKQGFGIAIMNRLLNACNNNYIEIN